MSPAKPTPTAPRPTRDRLITAAMEQFRRHGYHGTGIKAILRAADVPYGSLYHFFPGGKEELATVALAASAEAYRELVELQFQPGDDMVDATRVAFRGAGEVLAATEWADPCPVATLAAEMGSTSEPMRQAAEAGFESWLTVIESHLSAAGVTPARARQTALALVGLIEGAFVMARTSRRLEAMEAAGESAAALVALSLAERPSRQKGSGRKIRSSI
jgi:TetR/AcrR family transcriptional regulator, lmrAB and yxaGH operons repressor